MLICSSTNISKLLNHLRCFLKHRIGWHRSLSIAVVTLIDGFVKFLVKCVNCMCP